jgi:hypothetical protein
MDGKVLGYSKIEDRGAIKGSDESRYYFSSADIIDGIDIKSGMRVDFIAKDGRATQIYRVGGGCFLGENIDIILGLISLGLTFFLGFIGTFLSRVVISKIEYRDAIAPTLIHMVATASMFMIPLIGNFIYFVVTIYYMYKNYLLVLDRDIDKGSDASGNKYENYK